MIIAGNPQLMAHIFSVNQYHNNIYFPNYYTLGSAM